jgi:hypothetical protein
MKFSVFCRKLLWRTQILFFLSLLAPACSFLTKEEPEAVVLEQRTRAFIDIGWSWLHAENIRFLRGSWQGERYLAVLEYEIVSDAELELLSEFEKERFSFFLPMCADRTIQAGSRCRLAETVPFVNSGEYGWMPEFSLRLGDEQLAFIARGKTD